VRASREKCEVFNFKLFLLLFNLNFIDVIKTSKVSDRMSFWYVTYLNLRNAFSSRAHTGIRYFSGNFRFFELTVSPGDRISAILTENYSVLDNRENNGRNLQLDIKATVKADPQLKGSVSGNGETSSRLDFLPEATGSRHWTPVREVRRKMCHL